jgi:peroxin-6
MLYLSVSTDHKTQHNILSALTRKFNLDPDLDLMAVAERCPFNYTGADFYALCSDAMLKAMSRTASEVDKRISELAEVMLLEGGRGADWSFPPTRVSALLESTPEPRAFPKPLTPQYYLSAMAKPEETEVLVTEKDFIGALEELIPSVSLDDIQHYESVRRKFASETLNSESKVNGDVNGDIKKKDKGKGKARA